ncbi:hypothetical protein CKAN_01601300 [Cinnamomum micranthum f. kanehirae]|uniref:Uncharacterized protein n=1 Tax=Cinnamomum micranthum f. kanehirae TaxID=337451 RepID=A0A3S3PB98_9MAGN|nr:hypothetical protein CKAN_01601300 [Cinnamomum micranthum f. kanehirae]
MGICVSTDRKPDSALKFRFSIASKAEKMVIPSPTEEELMNGENPSSNGEKQMYGENPIAKSVFQTKTPGSQFGFYSPSSLVASRDFGSREESFFDTHAWLESDCEDDFYSVNGDFTPSRGNTPNHQRSFPGTPRFNKDLSFDTVPAPKPPLPSPTDKRKKLADLFRESMERNQMDDYQSISSEVNTATVVPPKSLEVTPCISKADSARSNETTPNKDTKLEREKRVKAAQCCMPSLVPSLSSSNRKKQLSPGRLSPGRRSGG